MPDDLDLKDEFEREGAVVVPQLLNQAWIDRLLDAVEACRAAPSQFHAVLSKPGEPHLESDLFRWLDNPVFEALARSSPLTELASKLIGSREVVFIEDQWFHSDPGAVSASPWHQDHPYYNVDRPFITIWATLDDVDAEASLRVVPRSHSTGAIYSPVEFSATSTTIGGRSPLPPVPDIDADLGRHRVRSWNLCAGDAVAFDSRMLHSTGVKPSGGRLFRRISTRWIHPEATYSDLGEQAATFWRILPHGLVSGDRLASEMFPLVGLSAKRRANSGL